MADIYIVGLGVLNVDQITHQAQRAIKRCREVLYVDTGIATGAYLEGLCPRITSLYEMSYQETGHRLNAYYQMAARVVEAALDHPPVAFAMHGHPIVGTYAPFLIQDMAGLLSLEVEVQPGISAMDCLCAELMLDPTVAGLQMYEATDLLLRRRPLQRDVPAMIWQVGCVESRLHTMRVSKPTRFERLRDHLLRYYPPAHEVTAAYSSPHPLLPSALHRFTLGALCEQAPLLHAGFSLLIPAVADRPIEDYDLRQRLDSKEHLRHITQ